MGRIFNIYEQISRWLAPESLTALLKNKSKGSSPS
jgi:hypothetical protein